MAKSIALLLFAVFMFLFLGCSNGNNPVTDPGNQTFKPINVLPAGVSDWNPDGSPRAGMGMLGLFTLHVDPNQAIAEIHPLRKSSLTDVLEEVDITNFLMLAPCSDCAKIKSIELDPDGNPVITIGIRHPFYVGDPLKPISGRNRGDLHVFNIEGIVISNDVAESFGNLDQSIANLKLLNASGYTGYLDRVIDDFYQTGATIHPYILHFNDYSTGNFNPDSPTGFESVTEPGPSGNLVMKMGCDYDYKQYVFNIDEPFDFIYAVGCTYAVSAATKNQRFNPEYRIPQHNKKAASEVSVVITSNNLVGGDIDSKADIEIHVVDVSHGVEVGTALNQMLADSSVGNIMVEIPGIVQNTIVIDGGSSQSGTGHDPSDPLIYSTTINNELGALEGIYTGLLKVTDTYPPGLNTSPLLNGMDGIMRVDPLINPLAGLFPISEFATYQVFAISVGEGCIPPVVNSIDPNILSNSPGFYNDVSISGEYFSGSGGVTQVYLDNSLDQIYATDINVISDTSLTCDFDISSADVGLYDVVVFTACEGRGDDLVEITGFPPEWVCAGYNHSNLCGNPNPQSVDPLNMTRIWNNTTSGSPHGFKTGGVVIADGKVFFMAEPTGYYYSSTDYSVFCLDLNDGHEIWRGYINNQGESGRALGSPIWYDNKVYAGGDEIHCFDDETGALIWSYNGTAPDNWCFISNSPKAINGKVICNARWGVVACVDAETGDEIWTYDYPGGEMLCATDGERVYAPSSNDLYCLDIDDGSFIWTQHINDAIVAWSGPVISGDRVYQCGWFGSFNCYDKYNGNLIWSYDITQLVYLNGMPAQFIDSSDNKPVFIFGSASSGSPLWAIKDDGASPSVMWSNIFSNSPYYDGAAIILDDYALIGDRYNSQLLVVNKMTGTLDKTYTLSSLITSQAASAFDRIVVITDNSIECYM
jgi:outer membrane protein assembly factor BamB